MRAIVSWFRDRPFVLTAEGWSTEGCACSSAIDEELYCVDVGGVIGGEEENCFCVFFRLAETTERNGRRRCFYKRALPQQPGAAPDGGSCWAGRDDIDANVSWRKVGGKRAGEAAKAGLTGSIGGIA